MALLISMIRMRPLLLFLVLGVSCVLAATPNKNLPPCRGDTETQFYTADIDLLELPKACTDLLDSIGFILQDVVEDVEALLPEYKRETSHTLVCPFPEELPEETRRKRRLNTTSRKKRFRYKSAGRCRRCKNKTKARRRRVLLEFSPTRSSSAEQEYLDLLEANMEGSNTACDEVKQAVMQKTIAEETVIHGDIALDELMELAQGLDDNIDVQRIKEDAIVAHAKILSDSVKASQAAELASDLCDQTPARNRKRMLSSSSDEDAPKTPIQVKTNDAADAVLQSRMGLAETKNLRDRMQEVVELIAYDPGMSELVADIEEDEAVLTQHRAAVESEITTVDSQIQALPDTAPQVVGLEAKKDSLVQEEIKLDSALSNADSFLISESALKKDEYYESVSPDFNATPPLQYVLKSRQVDGSLTVEKNWNDADETDGSKEDWFRRFGDMLSVELPRRLMLVFSPEKGGCIPADTPLGVDLTVTEMISVWEAEESKKCNAADTPTTTTIVPAIQDAYTRDGSKADVKIGSTDSSRLTVKLDVEGNNRITFLKFDISGIAGAITDARVSLKVKRARTVPVLHDFYSVKENGWDESTITWNNMPVLNDLLDTVTIGVNEETEGTFINFDATTYVNDLVSRNEMFASFAIVSNTNSYGQFIQYFSKEVSVDDGPVLQVTSTDTGSGTLPSGPPAVCYDTVDHGLDPDGKNADAGCVSSGHADSKARAPLCVNADGSEPGNGNGGNVCVRCVNDKYGRKHGAETDKGCGVNLPICVAKSMKEAPQDQAGKFCVKCINDNGATLGGGQDLGCTNGKRCVRVSHEDGSITDAPLNRKGNTCL